MLGEVRHRRYRPFAHEFRLKVLYLDLVVEEIQEINRTLRLFSRNGFNAYALNDRDHQGGDGAGLVEAMTQHVADIGGDTEGLRIITQPSAFGYVFNPVSFFVTKTGDASPLVVAEVHNRRRERHLYDMRLSCHNGVLHSTFAKEFYVSPFIPMEGWYEFSMEDDGRDSRFSFCQWDEGGLQFQADLNLVARSLNDANLAKALFTHPIVPWKTVGSIYLEAIKLKLRGAPYLKPAERGGSVDVAR